MSKFFSVCFCSLLVSCMAGSARAELIVAGPTLFYARAVQDITLFAGTPFNDTGSDLFFADITGFGFAGINRETQVGTTIDFNSVIGWSFDGSNDDFGVFRFGAVGPFTGADYSGAITNVVQDEADPGFATGDPSSFLSGDVSFSGSAFAFEFLSGDLAGVILTTDPTQNFSFVADFDGLPPSPGTVFLNDGDDALNVLFNGDVIGTTSNRRVFVTAVPEPGTFAALSAIGGIIVLRKRRSKVPAGK